MRANKLDRTWGLFALFRRMSGQLWLALGLFVIGGIGGAFFSSELRALILPLLHSLRQVATTMRSETKVQVMSALFENNVRVSLVMLIGGAVFGLIPAFGVLANGAIVGYVLEVTALTDHVNPVLMFVAGILPHGVFEIPAYLLASGFGMRLGWLVARSIVGRGSKGAWRAVGRDLAPCILWVVSLLFVAAVIEGGVTRTLIAIVIGHPAA